MRPAQFPGAPESLAAYDLIGINSIEGLSRGRMPRRWRGWTAKGVAGLLRKGSMILVDERTRERVEEVVAELLRTGDYDKVFRIADDD